MTGTTSTKAARTVSPEVRARYIAACITNYATADAAGKRAIRAALKSHMKACMAANDLTAFEWHTAINALPSKVSLDKPAVDYGTELAVRIATLRAAADLLESGAVTPEGMPADTMPQAVEASWSAVRESANRLASAKITRSTDRNSIGDVIARAIEGQESGTFLSVADVRRMGAIEGYVPSDGAIAARLFPADNKACTVPGVTPAEATSNQPRGLIVN
jgi:hypothetical protein